ncbi:phosphatase PAP2 family protein [Pontibacter sp. 172403-2]|uniref:phosphatase PAP2 family protein n=1 Tax=Pontibacter rufus TaxID=2791028 RepID=UPI0018AF81A0|nr:phosphatase PAP2 family protein [Pontibacter sp. 172403-2]MBF9255302.1 phosphatase PAP2 family protein [Pontibacter sp. 172403-2]
MKNILTHYVQQALAWLLRQPPVRRFRRRYPRVSGFIAGRFNPKVFTGLPLTLILIVFGINLALLSELAESVIESESIVTLDKSFTALLFSIRTEWLSQVMYGATQLGEQWAVFVAGGIMSLIFLFRKKYVALLAFWLALAGVGISTRYGKTFVSRERPANVAYYEVEHFSFPSGHATTALAQYGLIAYFLYRHYRKRRQRQLILGAAIILILIVGFSRIYLGVHYLSDVLAGFLLGILWLLVGISLMEVMVHRRKRQLSKAAPISKAPDP